MDVPVVVPAHDEEGNLRHLVDRLRETRSQEGLEHSLEIVVVDDNSTDETGEICDDLAAQHVTIQVVHLTKRLGFGYAIKAGSMQGMETC